uniref:Pecanex-like protein n=1 Tax=Angiostrongylus cantonensis TaxID=6313 RepID=A0A0K0D3S7_ANGCA
LYHNFSHSRLCLLLGPSLFSITLLLITVFPTSIKNNSSKLFFFGIFCLISQFFVSFRALPRVMLIVVMLDVFWRVAFFFQLLELDFQFRIVTGSEYGDRILHYVLKALFEVRIINNVLSALY